MPRRTSIPQRREEGIVVLAERVRAPATIGMPLVTTPPASPKRTVHAGIPNQILSLLVIGANRMLQVFKKIPGTQTGNQVRVSIRIATFQDLLRSLELPSTFYTSFKQAKGLFEAAEDPLASLAETELRAWISELFLGLVNLLTIFAQIIDTGKQTYTVGIEDNLKKIVVATSYLTELSSLSSQRDQILFEINRLPMQPLPMP